MTDRDERMALWLAFTVKEFTPEEIQILTTTLQTKTEEIKALTAISKYSGANKVQI